MVWGIHHGFVSLGFIPHGHCYLWKSGLVWLHLLSDGFIALAYFSIPVALLYFVQRRRDLPYPWLFLLFGGFIIACGLTHVLSIWTLWHPNYWTSGGIKALTAVVSLMTAATMIPVIPEALTLPGREELERAKADLEQRVLERTQALQVSEERLQMALAGSGDGLWDWNIVTGEVYLSPRWQEMLGYGATELPGNVSTWETLIHPEDKAGVMKSLRLHLQDSRVPYAFDYRVKMKSGEWKWIGNYGQVVTRNDQGEAIRMTGTHKDISDRKQREQELAESLAEKNVMLQEIHHRVKNNLQVICSMLNLQTKSTDPLIAEIVRESQNRVRSMALVHENLYQSENLSKINLEDYIKDLSKNLLKSYRSSVSQTKINVDTSNIYLNIDVAVPCGLIINELVSNALKYAFPQHQTGEVNITISKKANQDLILTVSDNGIGLPAEVNIEQTATMGLRMVKALIQQISGSLIVNREAGTSFQIIFPQKLY
ncbi:MAG: sensor histidine kinase [Leptolyngbyaceae cyanobacterium]